MKLLTLFTTCLLVELACTAPTSNEVDDKKVLITTDFFPESLVQYTGEHEIVNLLVPLNALNFEEDSDDKEGADSDIIVFFVEADTNEKGERIDQGLYMLKNKHATKLLDNGRDAAAANDDTKTVYFAAKDGIYFYNETKKTTEKYGTLTESLISIAKVNGSDIFYVLTEDLVLYKVTEEGTKKNKIDNVVNAKQIVLDYQNNLYYYTKDKEVYAMVGDEVKKIEGLPQNPTSVSILKPPFVLDNGLPVVVDKKSYIVYENGTSELSDFEFDVKPTAYAMEGTLIQYFAYDKKIYEYNILTIIFGEMLTQLKSFLDDKSDSIQSIATRSRNGLRA